MDDPVILPRELAEQLDILVSSFVETYRTHNDETGSDYYPTDGAVLAALREEMAK